MTSAAAPGPELASLSWAQQTRRSMTLAQKVGQLVVPYVSGATADEAQHDNRRRFGVATPAQAVRELHLGGVIYFAWSGNVDAPEQIATLSNGLQEASAVPLTIATDQETGSVSRVSSALTQFPGAMALGATHDPADTFDAYAIVGRELSAIGINTDYAPVADVFANPANPIIGVRAFSADPTMVAAHVAAAVAGLQSSGVSATAKHFPGHGDTTADSHVALPVIGRSYQEWDATDAPGFRGAIRAGCDAVMTGHLAFPELDPSGEPASLSHHLTTGLLRGDLGFTGVIVTDSLRMAGVRGGQGDGEIAVRALLAGADVLLDPEEPLTAVRGVLAAVRSGRVSEARLDQSVDRILAGKHARGLVRSSPVELSQVGAALGTPRHLARAQEITDRSVTLLSDPAGLVPLPAGSVLVTGRGDAAVSFLAQRLRRAGRVADAHLLGSTVDAGATERAVAASRGCDLTVVTTASAWRDPGQQALVAALVDAGGPVVVLALRDASDAATLPRTPTVVATYSSSPVALESAVRLLTGQISPRGRLPVAVSSWDDPGLVRYPLGHRL